MLQNRVVANTIHKLLWYIMMVLLTFMYVYQFRIPIQGLSPQIHSVRVASVLILLAAVVKTLRSHKPAKRMKGLSAKKFKKFNMLHCFLFLYVAFLAIALGPWTGVHMVTIIINLFLFTIIPIAAYYQLIDDFEDFMIILLFVTIIQAVIIWICALDSNTAFLIDSIFNKDSFLDVDMNTMRMNYSGGIGCVTSAGVVRFSVGLVACSYLYFKKRLQLYLVLLLFLGLTCSMIARTGILIALISILTTIIYSFKTRFFSGVSSLVWLSIIVVFAFTIISNSTVYSNFLSDRFIRASQLAEEQEYASSIMDISFFHGYFAGDTRKVPGISMETIIGTGVISGKAGNGIEINVDGGYLRLYVGYGLILSVFFYIYLFYTFLTLSRKARPLPIKYSMFLMLVIIFISELKEWSIYSSCHLMVFFLMSLLSENETDVNLSGVRI